MDQFYFDDWNYPGVVYLGTQQDFNNCQSDGGFPHRWNGPTAPVGQTIDVHVKEEGQVKIEQWDILSYST